jgi:hypothetical protein
MLKLIIVGIIIAVAIFIGLFYIAVERGREADCYSVPVNEIPKYCWDYVDFERYQ